MARNPLRTWYETLRRGARAHRTSLNYIAAAAVLITGVALGIASIVPEISLVGTATFGEGQPVPPRSFVNFSLPTNFGIAEFRLGAGNCSVFVYALNDAQFQQFNSSGVLPASVLDCDHRVAGLEGPTHWIVVQNRGPTATPYRIDASFFVVRSTRALLAFAALPFILGGSMFFIIQGFRREVGKLARILQEQRVLERRQEEEEKETKR